MANYGRASSDRRYPSKADIQRVVAAATASGLRVGSIEVAADGTIRLSESQGDTRKLMSDFDRLDAEGRL